MAITYPMPSLRFRNITFARHVSAVVWVTAIIIALPAAILMREEHVPLKGRDHLMTVCAFKFGKDAYNRYYSVIAVITFIIPSFLMAIVYMKMFSYIFGTIRKSPNPETENARQLKNSSRRAAKSVFVIVVVWLLCFFPFWLNHFLYTTLGVYEEKMMFATFAGLLSYLNSTVNPFLYTLMPKRYNVWKKLKSRPPAYEPPNGQAFCWACVRDETYGWAFITFGDQKEKIST